jgi:predicted transposase YdaD
MKRIIGALTLIADTRENISENDTLIDAKQRAVIDQILEENKDLPGATMVVLNGLQEAIGFISPAMNVYVAKKTR